MHQNSLRRRQFVRGTLALLAACGLTALLAACTPNPAEKELSETLKQYETIIRWSQWDAAADFLAPEYLVENPVSRLDMDRLRLFKVTSYTLRSTGIFDNGLTARQQVEIRLFNKRQGIERSIVDEQEWHWNETAKRWYLHSGLPDPTQRY